MQRSKYISKYNDVIFNILKKLQSPLYFWDKIEINTFASQQEKKLANIGKIRVIRVPT